VRRQVHQLLNRQSDHRPSHHFAERAATAVAIACGLASGTLHAQARTTVTPAVSIGAVYDDNILGRPARQTDHVWRVSPDLTVTREMPRGQIYSNVSFDGEWFSRYRDLSTPAARQHAAFMSDWEPSPTTKLRIDGGYDSSLTPEQLNIGTAISTGRARAWRWAAGPTATMALSGRYDLTASYQVSSEILERAPSTLTHDAAVGFSETLSGRDSWRLRYRWQAFLFEEGNTILSHTALAGWTRQLKPALELSADGGVRFAAERIRPDIAVRLQRRTTSAIAYAEYAWTETTSIAVSDLVETHRLTGSLGYEPPDRIGASLLGGVYLNDLGPTRVDVYRAAAEIAVPLPGVLSLRASYGFDYQRGRLQAPAILTPVGGLEDGLLALPPTIGSDENIRRGVLLVRLVLSANVRTPRTEPIDRPGRRGEPGPDGSSPGGPRSPAR
jgi:hypothetical protein